MAGPSQSDSEDERALRPSDEYVLREEADIERLLQAPQSSLGSLAPWANRDPNTPRTVHLSPQERKKERRKHTKMRRRRREEEEALLIADAGDHADTEEYELHDLSSDEDHATEPKHRKTRQRLLHFVLIPLTLMGLFAALLFGAYKSSQGRASQESGPRPLRSNGTHSFRPTTILVSLDGFRADFLQRNLTPTLNSFIADGVSPKYMLPSFPSVTFPNHWTLVTGLHPESHGVVGNSFWDPDLQEEFYYTDPARSMSPKWWNSTGAEPLWSTCEKAGVRSAIHMWPGSEAGVLPDAATVDKFNGGEALPRKVDRVLSFLDRPSEQDRPNVAPSDARPEFIAMYVPNVDADGHKYGPNSTEIRKTIRAVDDMLSSLLAGLRARNLTDVVNVVVVSDHGMATTSTSRLMLLDELLDPGLIEHIDGWPLYGLRPRKGGVSLLDLYTHLLGRASWPAAHFKVFLRDGMPERWHFKHNERIAPLWIIPDTGWAIVRKDEFDLAAAKKNGDIYHPRGLHGYDHEHPLMWAIFVARGPAFPHVPGSKLDVFQNIEVYNIVCDSLGIEPKPNNGTLRLPLKPVGTHGDDDDKESDGKEDDIVDLPSDDAADSSVKTDQPPPSPESSNEEVDSDIDQVEEQKPKSTLKKVWDAAKGKFDQVKSWVSGLFSSGSKEEPNDTHT